MKRQQAASAPAVNDCPQCTTPNRCGRKDLSGARGPRCVGRADGLDDCDCLNGCGDDPWLAQGKAKPCARRSSEEAAALYRTTAGPAEYASWFPMTAGAVAPVSPMPVERIAMLWNSLPLETDPESVVAFVRAVERFHGIGTAGVQEVPRG